MASLPPTCVVLTCPTMVLVSGPSPVTGCSSASTQTSGTTRRCRTEDMFEGVRRRGFESICLIV